MAGRVRRVNAFEYAVALWGILMGLAVADLILSANRLVRHADGVRWDGRALVATGLIALELVRMWFAQWSLTTFETALSFPVFLALCGQVVLLVFVASAALPGETPGLIDLTAHYERNRRTFWGLFAACQTVYFVMWLTFFAGSVDGSAPASALDWFRILGPLALYLTLATVRLKWLDWIGPLGLMVFYLWLYRGQSIG
ncbi:hypothetical protein [Brevundimonas sp.]|jgi:hypothetical protein|uniref:hypothetical protein n=1 Tax=Brevundimonas sp. TaxID=1871086 RepID=UPI00391A6A1F